MNIETILSFLLILIGFIIVPRYSAWIMERRIKKYIPEGTKERGEKILNDIEILIQKTKEFYGAKK